MSDRSSEKISGGRGLNLAIDAAGNPDGPSIVFIHGFTGSRLTWERQFSGPLAEEFHLVTFDLRGHGASDKPIGHAPFLETPERFNRDLADFVRSARRDRSHLP